MAATLRATKKKEILSKKRQAITTAEYLEKDSKVKPPEPKVIPEGEEKKADDLPELPKQQIPKKIEKQKEEKKEKVERPPLEPKKKGG